MRLLIFSLLFFGIARVGHFSSPEETKPFGVIDDSYEVNPSGAYNHIIPLHVSPGIKGLVPNLAMIYDSRSGISELGYGWSLTGVSKIVRGPNNFAQHGQFKGVDFSATDVLLLDGQYLTCIEGTNTLPKSNYRTENETFSIIRALGTINNARASAKYFLVQQANGLKYFYGKTDDSRVEINMGENRREVFEWNVNRIEDQFGNFMEFEYQQSDNKVKIISIKYTGNTKAGINPSNEIVFNYETENKRKSNVLFVSGVRLKNDDVLNSIGIKTKGRFFKFYHFKYNEARSQLLSVIESADQEAARSLSPTTISWNTFDSTSFHVDKKIDIPNLDKSKLIDFNNDGIDERVLIEKRTTAGRDSVLLTVVTFENGEFRNTVINEAIDAWPASITSVEDKIIFPDINGDGLRDIVADNLIFINNTVSGKYRFRVLNTGNCTECKKLISFNGNDSKLLAKDLDGNGKDELILVNTNKANGLLWILGFNKNNEFVKLDEITGNFPSNPALGATLETGSIEELVVFEKDNSVARRVSFKRGKLSVRQLAFPADLPRADLISNSFSFRDFNLDGIDDAVILKDNTPIQCWLFDGLAFAPMAQGNPGYFNGNNPRQRSHIGFFTTSESLQLLNIVNGASRIFNINFFEHGQMSFTEVNAAVFKIPDELLNASTVSYYDWDFTELNGDGNIDIKLKTKKDGKLNGIWEYLAPVSFVNRIKAVTDGFNSHVFVEYGNIRDRTNYSFSDKPLAANYLLFAGHYVAVKNLRISNGLGKDSLNTISFRYKNLIIENSGRGLAGFEEFNKTEESSGITTATRFEYKFPFTGKILQQKKLTKKGIVFFDQTNNWELKQFRGGLEPKDRDRIRSMMAVEKFNNTSISYLPVLSRSTVVKRELDNVVSSKAVLKYSYNSLAQIQETLTEFGDGSSLVNKKTFLNINKDISEDGVYILGLIASDINYTYKGNDTAGKRTIHYEYDSKIGFLKSEIRQKGHPVLERVQQYAYDLTGNLVEKKTIAGNSSVIAEQFAYTDDGRFIDIYTNPLGFKTRYEFESAYGSQRSVTDPNGLENTYDYDEFGNIIKETTPDGRSRTYAYDFLQSTHDKFHGSNSNALYKLTITESGAKEVIKYYDKLGREVSSLYYLLDSSYVEEDEPRRPGIPALPGNSKRVERKVLHFVQYDNNGNVLYDYKPQYVQVINERTIGGLGGGIGFRNFECVQFEDSVRYRTEYTYDDFNRPVRIKLADGKIIRKEYFAGKQIEHDPEERKIVTHYNEKKQIVAVADDKNNLVRYEYNLVGSLSKVVDADGNLIEMSYDLLGRKIAINDPSIGSVKYEYDKLDRLVRETTGSRVIDLSYDSLSRLTRKTVQGEGTIRWEYDKTVKGALEAITDIHGNKHSFKYDKFSRIESETQTLGSKSFTVKFSYDSLSRMASKQYPNGYSIGFEYLNNLPVRVKETKTNRTLWKIATLNEEGKITNKIYGNGIVSTYGFNKANGLVEAIETRRIDFAFRPTLKSCPKDLKPDDFIKRQFEKPRMFDPKNPQPGWTDPVRPDIIQPRLTSRLGAFASMRNLHVEVRPVQSLRFEYDNKYNIKAKYDLVSSTAENYTYDNLNRLEQVVFADANQQRPKLVISYDSKGNILSKSDQGTYEYDSEAPQRVKFITSRGTLVHGYEYDEFGNIVEDKVTGLKIGYTSFNKPDTIQKGNIKKTIRYGVLNEEIESSVFQGNSLRTFTQKPFYDFEIINENGTELSLCYVILNGELIAIHNEEKSQLGTSTSSFNLFVHKDHLGSVHTITDEQARKVTEYAYSPFGERRLVAGRFARTLKGFTSHEHLDEFELINAGGRYYLPGVGRFVSADPFIQSPTDLQSLNRYSYVRNNPINNIDPSGFFFKKIAKAFSGAVRSIGKAVHNVGRAVVSVAEAAVQLHVKIFEEGERFVNKYGKQILIIAAAAAITYFSGGTLAGFGAAMIKGAIMGAVISAGFTAARGGNFQDILNAGFSGAISGAAAGAMAYGLASASTAMFKEASYGKHLLGGVNGYVSTGGSEEGLYKGVLASFIPEDLGATEAFETNHYANFFLQVGSSAARGYVIDGEEGMKTQVIGTIGTNALGHAVGFTASGFKKPEFERGVYLYESKYSGSVALGNAATVGTDSPDRFYMGRGFQDPELRDHEIRHYTEQNTLGAVYFPVHIFFAIPGTPVHGTLDRPPYHSNPEGGGYSRE